MTEHKILVTAAAGTTDKATALAFFEKGFRVRASIHTGKH